MSQSSSSSEQTDDNKRTLTLSSSHLPPPSTAAPGHFGSKVSHAVRYPKRLNLTDHCAKKQVCDSRHTMQHHRREKTATEEGGAVGLWDGKGREGGRIEDRGA